MQDLSIASAELGNSLIFAGEVILGKQIGRTIGFRTANVAAPDAKPDQYGVYTTTLTLEDSREYHGVANLGVKPTVGSEDPLLEVHIFDFCEDIYGQRLVAWLHQKIRHEQKFKSADALQAQLKLDLQLAQQLMFSHARQS